MAKKQSYQYKKENSILGDLLDEYDLSENEYYRLYSFYVTFSLCGTQSAKKRKFVDYGWPSESIKETVLGQELKRIVDLGNANFVFTDQDELKDRFAEMLLSDGTVTDLSYERCVIGKTNAPNKYMKLFYRVRDGFAHGKFCLRLSNNNEKMVIIQDDDGHNVTGRIVMKLNTLLSFVDVIDPNRLI